MAIYPVLIDLGPVKVHAWGFMMAVGVLAAVFGISRRFKQEGYDPDHALDLAILLVVAGLLGSRLAYIMMFEWQEFLVRPAIFFSLRNGGFEGLVWYGGFTAGVLAFIIYNRVRRYPFWKMADIVAPYLALAYAIVRIGCFLNGCCYGLAADAPCTVVFPEVDGLHRYPTQLFSSALNLLLFGILSWYYPRRRFDGQIFAGYLIGYAVYRFVVEFWRENWVFYGLLSIAQVYSLLILAAGIALYLWRRSAAERRPPRD